VGRLFRCCLPCRGGSSSAPAGNHQLEKKHSLSATTIQTPTGNYTTVSLTSPLIHNTIVTTTLIGITTVTASTSSPILKPKTAAPLIENTAAFQFLKQQSSSPTSPTGAYGVNQQQQQQSHQSSDFDSPLSIASLSTISTSSQSSPSSQQPRFSQTHILTLPHIDEDDELKNIDEDDEDDPNCANSYLISDRGINKVQNDNLINLNNTNNNFKSENVSITPSPKIKVSRIKFTHQDRDSKQTQQKLISSSSSLSNTSSESESSIATIQQHQQTTSTGTGGDSSESVTNLFNSGISGQLSPKMQAEQGSIAELQKYHNKYLRNRRHTLANVR
jgi:hypothetical protein